MGGAAFVVQFASFCRRRLRGVIGILRCCMILEFLVALIQSIRSKLSFDRFCFEVIRVVIKGPIQHNLCSAVLTVRVRWTDRQGDATKLNRKRVEGPYYMQKRDAINPCTGSVARRDQFTEVGTGG